MVAAGLTNKAIAKRLSISIRTVEGHIYHACTKLTCRTEPCLPTPWPPRQERFDDAATGLIAVAAGRRLPSVGSSCAFRTGKPLCSARERNCFSANRRPRPASGIRMPAHTPSAPGVVQAS